MELCKSIKICKVYEILELGDMSDPSIEHYVEDS